MDKIVFKQDGEEPAEFYVLEQTTVGGRQYILVTDSEEEDGEALILKDLSEEDAEEGIYEIVTDDQEMRAVAEIFSNILEDVDLV